MEDISNQSQIVKSINDISHILDNISITNENDDNYDHPITDFDFELKSFINSTYVGSFRQLTSYTDFKREN